MSVRPLNWGLLVVLLILVGANFALDRSAPVGREVGKLFPELFADRAARFVLEDGDERIEAVLDPEAGWILPDHFDHPAQEEIVARLMRALTSMSTLDLLSEDSASHAEYGVGDGARTLRVWDADGELLAGLVQGAEVGALASYVRRMGEDAVYRAPKVRSIPLARSVWLDAQWMPFSSILATGVRISGELLGEPLEYTRDESRVDRWRGADGELRAASSIKNLLNTVQSLAFDEVVAARPVPEQLGGAALELEIRMLDGTNHVGSFGPAEESGVLAWHDTESFVVRFTPAMWDALVKAIEKLR